MYLPASNRFITNIMEKRKLYQIILLSILYQAINAACLPLDFRFINIFGFNFSCSALIYPILYV